MTRKARAGCGGFFLDREPPSRGVRRLLGVSALEKEASYMQGSWEETGADLCDQVNQTGDR